MQKRVKRKEVRYNRPEVAGIFYHENMTYYHNAVSYTHLDVYKRQVKAALSLRRKRRGLHLWLRSQNL